MSGGKQGGKKKLKRKLWCISVISCKKWTESYMGKMKRERDEGGDRERESEAGREGEDRGRFEV